jgi:hypothetical protein
MALSGLAQSNVPKPPWFGQQNIRQRLIIFEMRGFRLPGKSVPPVRG